MEGQTAALYRGLRRLSVCTSVPALSCVHHMYYVDANRVQSRIATDLCQKGCNTKPPGRTYLVSLFNDEGQHGDRRTILGELECQHGIVSLLYLCTDDVNRGAALEEGLFW